MPIFQITPLTDNAIKVGESVKRHFSEAAWYELPFSAGWFVRFNGTTVELSKKLEVTGQTDGATNPIGSTLITHIVAYYGRGSTDMWEWLKTRFEAQG